MANYKFQQLTNARQFVFLIADCYSALCPRASIQICGLQEQKQYGIDILVSSENEIGIKCKNYYKISASDIDTILMGCTYKLLDKLIIATAAPEDTKITAHVKNINGGKNVPFSVEFLSWEKICSYIQQFPIIIDRYYGKQNCQDELRKIFIDIINAYYIDALLWRNPLIDELDFDDPGRLSDCCSYLTDLLHQNTERRTEMLYEKISQFEKCLASYDDYLGLIMFLDSDFYRCSYQHPDKDSEYRKHKEDVNQYRVKLTQLIDEIMRIS